MIKVMFGGPGDRNLLWEPDPDADPHAAARAAYESDHRHSLVAKQMQGLRRYAINRRFDGQPSFVDCDRVPQRIAELWWDSIQDVEDCFNSPSGLADLGDTSVRLPDVPINFPGSRPDRSRSCEPTRCRLPTPRDSTWMPALTKPGS